MFTNSSNNITSSSSSPYKGVDKSGRGQTVESYRSKDDEPKNQNFKKIMDEKNGDSSGEEENVKTSVFDLPNAKKGEIKGVQPQPAENMADVQLQKGLKAKQAVAQGPKTPTSPQAKENPTKMPAPHIASDQEGEITLHQSMGKKPGTNLIAAADTAPPKTNVMAVGKASSESAGKEAGSGLAKNKLPQEAPEKSALAKASEQATSPQDKLAKSQLSKESEQETGLAREEVSTSTSQSSNKKEKSVFDLARDSEKQVQPIIAQAYTATEANIQQNQPVHMPSPAKAVEEIARQIVDAVHLMRIEGRTDTIVTLRHPPLLAGSQVTLTTFEHAKGEFNISFSNLTSQGKTFLDQQLAQNNLQDSLERKGIVVHTLTTTTQVDNPLAMRADQPQRDPDQQQQQRQQQQQQEQQQQRQQQEQEQEEEII